MTAIALPRQIRLGGGTRAEIGEVLCRFGLERPLVVTDPFFVQSEAIAPLLADLECAGVPYRVFSGTVADPTEGAIRTGVAFLKEGNHDSLIAFGGGSPIDTAKAMSVLAVRGGRMRDLKAPHQEDSPALPIIAIPTTAGTGSEATRFTVVTDDETGEKMLCSGLAYLPTAAIVDYELTLAKPARLTADTGIDALTHAIEAYVSRKANTFSDGMALHAMRLIAPNLRRVFAEPGNRAARESVMAGATMAGMAFSNGSVALVHGMSRPLGVFFHIPHGLSNAMLLPAVTAFSIEAAKSRYADCAKAMGIVPSGVTDDTAAEALIVELRALNRDLQVPTPRRHRIDAQAYADVVDTMAAQAVASGSPANNPRIPTQAEIVELYREAWD